MGVKYIKYCDFCGKEKKGLSTSFSFKDKRFEDDSVAGNFILKIKHGYHDKRETVEPCFCEECFLNCLEMAVEQTKKFLESEKSNANN